MESHTIRDVENPTATFVPDFADAPLLEASLLVHAPPNESRLSRSILLLVSGLLAIGLAVAFVAENLRVLTYHIDDSTAPPKTLNPVEKGVSNKSFRSPVGVPSYPWTTAMLEWQKPAFHFRPEKNWMNDPNGPVYYKGWYHLFYQYSPEAPIWGRIVWGHAVSRDMVHWNHLPVAMDTDRWYDVEGVWTGSTTILPNNQIVVLYTGSTNESIQVQNLAYPANPSDAFLTKWVKYSKNPVLLPPPGIDIKDFRDPTTAWLTPEGKWRFMIGSKVNRTGMALRYDTMDFKTYELLEGWLHAVNGTGMWECVDFYPVSKHNKHGVDTSAYGPGVKHIVKASMDDDRCDYYSIGTYDTETGEWNPDDPTLDVGIGLRYDYGIYYASKTFYDQYKRRRILWSWIKETDNEPTDIKKGWASLMAVPRTVLLDSKTGSNLIQWPIEEIDKLRSNLTEFNNVQLGPGSLVPLYLSSSSQLDIMVDFEVDKEVLNRLNGETSVAYNCAGHGGAAERDTLGPFGLLVLALKNQTEQTPVYFYFAKHANGDLKTFFCVDQSRSSMATNVDKSIYGSTVPVLKGEKLSMRILVDHSIIESFAQGGRTCITSRIYPTQAINEDAQVFLFNNATDVKITASIKIWQMDKGKHSTIGNGWVWLGPALILLIVAWLVIWSHENQNKASL